MRLSGAVDAVTLRPGYRVTLYSNDGWSGQEETIVGAYEKGREKEERLECQKVKNKVLSDAKEGKNVYMRRKELEIGQIY